MPSAAAVLVQYLRDGGSVSLAPLSAAFESAHGLVCVRMARMALIGVARNTADADTDVVRAGWTTPLTVWTGRDSLVPSSLLFLFSFLAFFFSFLFLFLLFLSLLIFSFFLFVFILFYLFIFD